MLTNKPGIYGIDHSKRRELLTRCVSELRHYNKVRDMIPFVLRCIDGERVHTIVLVMPLVGTRWLVTR